MPARIALVGRPNVGKSTLFNRLIRSNRVITHDRAGITRDRVEGIVRPRDGRAYVLIDTGGVTLDQHYVAAEGPAELRGFEAAIVQQMQAAMVEAAAVCLVVDGREGLMPFDEHLADWLRRTGKPVLLAVNKVDGAEREDSLLAEFHGLGFPILAVSAEFGYNIRALQEELQALLPTEEAVIPEAEAALDQSEFCRGLKLTLLGRPNVGKSSIVNAMVGTDRMIVSNVPGTTRDSVDVPFVSKGAAAVFTDTAGVRRRPRITDRVEQFAVNASLKSSTKADVTLYVIDAVDGVTNQDKRLINLLDERKTPFMILVNKTDLISANNLAGLEKDLRKAISFCPHVPVSLVSALRRYGFERIIPLARQIRQECSLRVGTGALNRAIQEVLARHQPPVVKRIRPRFFYLTQAETTPPTFVFFVSNAERVGESYLRYLERSLRKLFHIQHAPMRVRLRSSHKKRGQ